MRLPYIDIIINADYQGVTGFHKNWELCNTDVHEGKHQLHYMYQVKSRGMKSRFVSSAT